MRYTIAACSKKYRRSISLATLPKCQKTPFSPRLLKSRSNIQNVAENPSILIGTYIKDKTRDIIRSFDDSRKRFICSHLSLFAHIFFSVASSSSTGWVLSAAAESTQYSRLHQWWVSPTPGFPHGGILWRVPLKINQKSAHHRQARW